MSPTEFIDLLAGRRFRGRTKRALYAHLVDGLTLTKAAAQCGIAVPTLSLALHNLNQKPRCDMCGHTLRSKKI